MYKNCFLGAFVDMFCEEHRNSQNLRFERALIHIWSSSPVCKNKSKMLLGASWQTLCALGTKIHTNWICGASGEIFQPRAQKYTTNAIWEFPGTDFGVRWGKQT